MFYNKRHMTVTFKIKTCYYNTTLQIETNNQVLKCKDSFHL